jgi:hypothetical protein
MSDSSSSKKKNDDHPAEEPEDKLPRPSGLLNPVFLWYPNLVGVCPLCRSSIVARFQTVADSTSYLVV